jgi:hypothetical protein
MRQAEAGHDVRNTTARSSSILHTSAGLMAPRDGGGRTLTAATKKLCRTWSRQVQQCIVEGLRRIKVAWSGCLDSCHK